MGVKARERQHVSKISECGILYLGMPSRERREEEGTGAETSGGRHGGSPPGRGGLLWLGAGSHSYLTAQLRQLAFPGVCQALAWVLQLEHHR